jgi:hypothetical protein
LDFKSVADLYGPNWVENVDAEQEHYNAIVREPRNPPPPKATGYMGNSIIKYVFPTSTISLGFSPDGHLSDAGTTAFSKAPPSGKPLLPSPLRPQ